MNEWICISAPTEYHPHSYEGDNLLTYRCKNCKKIVLAFPSQHANKYVCTIERFTFCPYCDEPTSLRLDF